VGLPTKREIGVTETRRFAFDAAALELYNAYII